MTERPYVQSVPYRDPVQVFARFAADPFAVLLDSAADAGGRGNYAYICADPFRTVVAGPAGVSVDGHARDGDPFTVLEAELARFTMPSDPRLPPFQGGAVGYLGYELGRYLETLPPPRPQGFPGPEMAVGLFDTVLAFDVQKKKAWIVARDARERDPALDRPPVRARADVLARAVAEAPPLAEIDWQPAGAWTPETGRADFERMVQRAIDYIYAGDIFQANLTQRVLATLPEGLDPFMLYRRLRALTPAPFGAFVQAGGGNVVASASPERFLRLDTGGRVSTRPIKGTRPRGATPDDDARLAHALTTDEKDRAENLMIVDLLRNDLSRVCRLGSVKVTELAALESFASVHHLVSEVRGTLFPNLGPVDLLRATFPGGSITGAPKIRAMEVINELEPARRGPYCGAVAWIGFDGAMDSSIVIRTLTVSGRDVVAQAGGGIVADSDPASEYRESMDKAWPLLQSLDPGGVRETKAQ